MYEKVWDLVYSDRQIQVEKIAQALGISHGSVSTILHDRLGMRKPTACWVPKSLSDEQMATRASVCSALMQPSAGKVMATVFWDAKGIMLDFLPKRSAITGVYYANLLDQLRTAIREKRWGKLSRSFAATGQHESPHLQSCSGCCRAKQVWINTTSCLFAWPSS